MFGYTTQEQYERIPATWLNEKVYICPQCGEEPYIKIYGNKGKDIYGCDRCLDSYNAARCIALKICEIGGDA